MIQFLIAKMAGGVGQRVAVALIASTALTTAVAGPMAVQTLRVRNAQQSTQTAAGSPDLGSQEEEAASFGGPILQPDDPTAPAATPDAAAGQVVIGADGVPAPLEKSPVAPLPRVITIEPTDVAAGVPVAVEPATIGQAPLERRQRPDQATVIVSPSDSSVGAVPDTPLVIAPSSSSLPTGTVVGPVFAPTTLGTTGSERTDSTSSGFTPTSGASLISPTNPTPSGAASSSTTPTESTNSTEPSSGSSGSSSSVPSESSTSIVSEPTTEPSLTTPADTPSTTAESPSNEVSTIPSTDDRDDEPSDDESSLTPSISTPDPVTEPTSEETDDGGQNDDQDEEVIVESEDQDGDETEDDPAVEPTDGRDEGDDEGDEGRKDDDEEVIDEPGDEESGASKEDPAEPSDDDDDDDDDDDLELDEQDSETIIDEDEADESGRDGQDDDSESGPPTLNPLLVVVGSGSAIALDGESVVFGSELTVEATASDGSEVELFLDGEPFGLGVGLEFSTLNMELGRHTFTVRSQVVDGRQRERTATFTVVERTG